MVASDKCALSQLLITFSRITRVYDWKRLVWEDIFMKRNRIIAIALSVFVMLSLIPLNVVAYGEYECCEVYDVAEVSILDESSILIDDAEETFMQTSSPLCFVLGHSWGTTSYFAETTWSSDHCHGFSRRFQSILMTCSRCGVTRTDTNTTTNSTHSWQHVQSWGFMASLERCSGCSAERVVSRP